MRDSCKSALKCEFVACEKCSTASFVTKLFKFLIDIVLDCPGGHPGNRAGKPGFCGKRKNRSFRTLRDIDRILQSRLAIITVVSVRDNHQHSSARRAPQFLVAKLPDRIVKPCLRVIW